MGWFSDLRDWAYERRATIASVAASLVVGTVVTVAVGGALAATIASGGVLAPLAAVAVAAVAGAAGGLAGGVAGYGAASALDEEVKFTKEGFFKAALVGAVVGGLTGGLLKGFGGAGGGAANEAAKLTAREVGKRVVTGAALGGATGAGGQVAGNVVENVIEGAPITSNLGRGVLASTALGVGVGGALAVADPVVAPHLKRLHDASARAARAALAPGSPPPVPLPTARIGKVVIEEAPPPAHEPRVANRARGPPEQVCDGLAQLLQEQRGGTGKGGAAPAEPPEPPVADAPEPRAKVAEPQKKRGIEDEPLGEEPPVGREERVLGVPRDDTAYAPGSAEFEHLIGTLQEQGVKVNPQEVLRVARARDGKIVFLEKGTTHAEAKALGRKGPAGLKHILEEHGSQFAERGIPESEVPDFVMEVRLKGTKVGHQGAKRDGRDVYRIVRNGKKEYWGITTGSNGFIVGANPSRPKNVRWLPGMEPKDTDPE